jgi:hypothetical protein
MQNGVLGTTAWHVVRFWPEGNCDCVQEVVADSRQRAKFRVSGLAWGKTIYHKNAILQILTENLILAKLFVAT